MKRFKIELVILGILLGVFLGRIPDVLALRGGSFDFFDPLVDIHADLMEHYVRKPNEKALLRGAIRGMLKPLNDPYTTYFTPEQLESFEKQTSASFSGIGAQIDVRDGRLMIVSPLEDSPAFKAGLQAGDIILKINGKPVGENIDIFEAVERITGPAGTEVRLTVLHPGSHEKEQIVITRQQIDIQTVKGFARDEGERRFMLDPSHGIAYIRLTSFAQPTDEKLRQTLLKLQEQGMQALILDLRFNPGGLLQSAVHIADTFLSEGVIVSTRDRDGTQQVWRASEAYDLPEMDFPIVVLVNRYSASASEIVAGALKDNERALIVGTRTFGKGSVQQVIRLSNGGALKLTTAHYYLPSGRNIHREPGDEKWGVDPSEGQYIAMTHEEIRKMTKLRREASVLRRGEQQDGIDQPITPQWIRKHRADPQLAAALHTMIAKLETGHYVETGKDNAQVQALLTQRRQLKRQREVVLQTLEEIEKKLEAINEDLAGEQEPTKVASEQSQASDDPVSEDDAPAQGQSQ